MSAVDLLFGAQLVCLLFMVGVIWFVQLVHYPLFAHVGKEAFSHYEKLHVQRTGWVVIPPMLGELATALALLLWRPAYLSLEMSIVNVALLGIIWLSTWGLQVPCHQKLSEAFDLETARRLVQTNWIRTVGWSLRAMLLIGALVVELS